MNRKNLLISIIILIILIPVFAYITASRGFRVTGYSPALNNIATVTPYLDVNFSNDVSKSNLNIYSPQSIVSSYKIISPKTVRVYFNIPFSENTKYQLILGIVGSTNGKILRNYSFSFNPVYINSQSLPKSQQQYLLSQQDKPKSEIFGTTLVNLLPFIGAGDTFLINYNLINQKPYITITTNTAQGKQQALTWITSQGYDPTKLNIIYINQAPF